MPQADTIKQIKIGVQKNQFEMGGPIPLAVRYTNNGDEAIIFREPEKTWEVQLLLSNQDNETEQVAFGRIFYYQGDGYERRSVEAAEEISLSPGENHTFVVNIGQRWTELFSPNKYTLQVIDESDDEVKIESDIIEISVRYTQNSFTNLIEITNDNTYSDDSRSFALAWTKLFFPSFEYTISNPTESQVEENKRAIDNALQWFKSNWQSKEFQQQMNVVNDKIAD